MVPTTTIITIADVYGLTQSIVTLNAQYLGISVTIILFVGGLFYVFNLKPLQDSLNTQEAKIGSLKSEIESRFTTLNNDFTSRVVSQAKDFGDAIRLTKEETDAVKKDIAIRFDSLQEFSDNISTQAKSLEDSIGTTKKDVEKLKLDADRQIQEATSQLKELESASKSFRLNVLWDKKYLWEARGVLSNAVTALVTYREESIRENRDLVGTELWLSSLQSDLEQMGVYTFPGDKENLHKRLLTLMGGIKEHSKLKEDVLRAIEKSFPKNSS